MECNALYSCPSCKLGARVVWNSKGRAWTGPDGGRSEKAMQRSSHLQGWRVCLQRGGRGRGCQGRAVGNNEHHQALCGQRTPPSPAPPALRRDTPEAHPTPKAGPWAPSHSRQGSGTRQRSFKRQRVPSGRGTETPGLRTGSPTHYREAGLWVGGREAQQLSGRARQAGGLCLR